MIALSHTTPAHRSLRLAQPLVRPGSLFELSSVLALTLTAAGIWLLLLPLELLVLLAG